MFAWIRCFLFLIMFHVSSGLFATEIEPVPQLVQSIDSTTGSWTFSGMVKNESGDKYGYFFEMHRQGSEFHTKAALIDGQTNQLVFFNEDKEKIEQSTPLDWHVGYSFIRYNPINDSWIFGVKTADKKGFNFKVDMLKQANNVNDSLILRPGVKLQVLQTSQLNGHLRIDDKEQFVTGNKTWFGKLVLNNDQKDTHEISTTFCRLTDDNGFYSANLKEKDATSAAVAGWLDPLGNKVKMSQFVSIKPLDNDLCMLSIGLPKLSLKLINTLKANDPSSHTVAGFSKDGREGFCFVTQQSFLKNQPSELGINKEKLTA
ncbi:hypothetical protein DGG96_02675 [Legionella qingyii]|uniref:Uncharacterized protein n=1 Tax=Legionella qingyii TaxID=2184757 RepID=A0A317U5E7_9GAMM|nr:hypothetical protein [Legionella qingyii]PWY56410.1 hypothetical protein DGG96_06515 [Legionella qingyii]PWY57233.1 hypothetical protein DGG96_02675 [Legionella qingyii]RUR24927.1 hypothetical protein ELY20_04005 [Legionella qingyii]RUR28799.1 hypothetical protein ELY16_01975 [Legionella qingyii]